MMTCKKKISKIIQFAVCGMIVVLSGLTGCQTTAPVAGNIDAALLSADDTPFTVQGRLAIKTQKESVSATFTWSHDNEKHNRDEILLSSPLGTMIARIKRLDETIKLYRGEKDISVFSLEDGDRAFDRALGFPLPIRDLPYWLRGAVSPESPSDITWDDYRRIATLSQDEWTISYTYATSSRLPDRVTAQYRNNTLNIKIDHWSR